MRKLIQLFAFIYLGIISFGAQAIIVGTTSNPSYTIKSACTPEEPVGYSLVKVGYVSGGPCRGDPQYDFIELKNLTQVTVCNFVAPPGWVSTGSHRDDTGTCGWGNPQHEITRISGDTLQVCSFVPPPGWVVTASRNTTNNVCGPNYPQHTITRLTTQVDMITCNYIAPPGWVVTQTNIHGVSAECGSTVNNAAHRIHNLAGMTKIAMCSKYLEANLKKPEGWNILSTSTTGDCGPDVGNTWQVMSATPLPQKVPLHMYYNSQIGDRVYGVVRNDLGYAAYGYVFSSIEGYVFQEPVAGAVPISEYYSQGLVDHLYTTERNDAGYSAFGYTYQRDIGYTFRVPAPGTVPLYKYYNGALKNRLYSLAYFTNGLYGYTYEGVMGYVYPEP